VWLIAHRFFVEQKVMKEGCYIKFYWFSGTPGRCTTTGESSYARVNILLDTLNDKAFCESLSTTKVVEAAI